MTNVSGASASGNAQAYGQNQDNANTQRPAEANLGGRTFQRAEKTAPPPKIASDQVFQNAPKISTKGPDAPLKIASSSLAGLTNAARNKNGQLPPPLPQRDLTTTPDNRDNGRGVSMLSTDSDSMPGRAALTQNFDMLDRMIAQGGDIFRDSAATVDSRTTEIMTPMKPVDDTIAMEVDLDDHPELFEYNDTVVRDKLGGPEITDKTTADQLNEDQRIEFNQTRIRDDDAASSRFSTLLSVGRSVAAFLSNPIGWIASALFTR